MPSLGRGQRRTTPTHRLGRSTDSPPPCGPLKPCEERHSTRILFQVRPPTSEHGVGPVESLPWMVDGTDGRVATSAQSAAGNAS